MNKAELVNEAAAEVGVTEKEARNVLESISPIPCVA